MKKAGVEKKSALKQYKKKRYKIFALLFPFDSFSCGKTVELKKVKWMNGTGWQWNKKKRCYCCCCNMSSVIYHASVQWILCVCALHALKMQRKLSWFFFVWGRFLYISVIIGRVCVYKSYLYDCTRVSELLWYEDDQCKKIWSSCTYIQHNIILLCSIWEIWTCFIHCQSVRFFCSTGEKQAGIKMNFAKACIT